MEYEKGNSCVMPRKVVMISKKSIPAAKMESIARKNLFDVQRKFHDLYALIKLLRKENHEELEKNTSLINRKIDKMQISLDAVNKKIFYNNNYERQVISSFYEMYERSDFKDKFLKLIQGLSNEDIEQIVLILQRQQMIKDTINQKLDIFSQEEQEKLLKIQKELHSQIFRVSDDMYCYKHYFLPVKHFEASVFCYKHGIDCIENLDVLKNKDILDVGGFIGDSILIFKPLTDKRVISFEAVKENYEILKQTVELNRLENVIAEHMALGSKECVVNMKVAGSCSSLSPNDLVTVEKTESVQMTTLDSYIESSDIDVGLIKVDIEGAEQDFMKGARKTIEEFKPILLMSIYHNADDFFHIKPVIESWNLGYKFKIHKPTDFSISREVLLIAEVR
ncbi:MAG: FkbM family methyltransferase [Eubacterium sp.]|nr:FkbM family methyltransferase [Eubacterium sp.]